MTEAEEFEQAKAIREKVLKDWQCTMTFKLIDEGCPCGAINCWEGIKLTSDMSFCQPTCTPRLLLPKLAAATSNCMERLIKEMANTLPPEYRPAFFKAVSVQLQIYSAKEVAPSRTISNKSLREETQDGPQGGSQDSKPTA